MAKANEKVHEYRMSGAAWLLEIIKREGIEKAEKELGWKRQTDFKGLVAMMMDADLQEIAGMSCEEYKASHK